MKKVLILNGHQYYDVVAKGELTQTYIDKANDFFLKHGFEVKHTNIEKGYNVEEECEKFQWADYVLFQYPVYWMSVPWIAKKYMLSLTYNCPESAFDNKNSLFDGLSLDEAHVAVHKTFQFCGLKPLETHAVHDIFKGDLDLDAELEKFEKVLSKNFL